MPRHPPPWSTRPSIGSSRLPATASGRYPRAWPLSLPISLTRPACSTTDATSTPTSAEGPWARRHPPVPSRSTPSVASGRNEVGWGLTPWRPILHRICDHRAGAFLLVQHSPEWLTYKQRPKVRICSYRSYRSYHTCPLPPADCRLVHPALARHFKSARIRCYGCYAARSPDPGAQRDPPHVTRLIAKHPRSAAEWGLPTAVRGPPPAHCRLHGV
jgi:hypothetical protein